MKNKRASVAKMVALVVLPLSLGVVVAQVGQERRAKAATQALFLLDLRRDPDARVDELIARGADVNARSNGFTNLHIAASRGDTQKIEELLDNGAEVNARGKVGMTALMYAVQGSLDGNARHIKARPVRLLMERGADLNTVDEGGRTVLSQALLLASLPEEASNYELKDIIQALKTAGAKE